LGRSKGGVWGVLGFFFSINVAKCKLYDGGGHGFWKKNIHSIPCFTLVPVFLIFFRVCEHEMMTYLITRFSTTCRVNVHLSYTPHCPYEWVCGGILWKNKIKNNRPPPSQNTTLYTNNNCYLLNDKRICCTPKCL
jgi:hypothetical protein